MAWMEESFARFTRRQVLAASAASLVLGAGLGSSIRARTAAVGQTSTRPTEVDLGFINDMLDHHDQAVEMSVITLGLPGVSGNVKNFATEVLLQQRYEIGLLEAKLDAWGVERAEPDRQAMRWMGMATSVATMPGMASRSELDQLSSAAGVDADRWFLTLMRAHHEGGVHMAEYAMDHASDVEVGALAGRMAYNQQVEIAEYTSSINALPPAASPS
jgi:uncharacterized protein (DUF305 family)